MAIKIQNDRPIQEATAAQPVTATRTSGTFSKQLTVKQERMQTDALQQLLTKIDEEGSRLLNHQTVKDLNNYKKYVHQFIQETVRYGLQTDTSRSWHQAGQQQTIVKKVDEKLSELTDHVLGKSKQPIDLLGKIGEIKGLLINLYI